MRKSFIIILAIVFCLSLATVTMAKDKDLSEKDTLKVGQLYMDIRTLVQAKMDLKAKADAKLTEDYALINKKIEDVQKKIDEIVAPEKE